ncbi:FAD-dependent oxidoreductase [Roseimaritima sediminicola]|uniref:FAD-dependent oxidoreductase n=1 Tax=Roseimaritima sediminicola TaxID=2662066 RepID=UPI0012985746|nr:FAD-dependent oxidoreductase [Roseimaritima sediminicola]
MPSSRTLVLLGIGHTNAEVVRRWIKRPIADTRLVCISKFPFATYSGMLPGTLSRQFEPTEMQIDLRALTKRAGAELILDEVTELDPATRTLHFAKRDALPFDVLSVGVGSMPAGWRDHRSPALVPIKPMQTFPSRLEERLGDGAGPKRCVIVGGGVAGVEVALCLDAGLAKRGLAERGQPQSYSITILTSGPQIADGMTNRSRRKLREILRARGIEVRTDYRVKEVDERSVGNGQDEPIAADVIIWATGAAAPPVLGRLGLATDERGFLALNPRLQSTDAEPIFAVGDCGTILQHPAPKAGVFAVRQAPVLWHNLRAALGAETAYQTYRPQSGFMKILNTGHGKALLEYKGHSAHARWCWWLKCWIDKRFVAKYQFRE